MKLLKLYFVASFHSRLTYNKEVKSRLCLHRDRIHGSLSLLGQHWSDLLDTKEVKSRLCSRGDRIHGSLLLLGQYSRMFHSHIPAVEPQWARQPREGPSPQPACGHAAECLWLQGARRDVAWRGVPAALV